MQNSGNQQYQRTEPWTPAVTNKTVLQIDQEKALGVALTKPGVPK